MNWKQKYVILTNKKGWRRKIKLMAQKDVKTLILVHTVNTIISSMRLRPLGRFLPPENHLISRLWSSYISSLFRFVIYLFFVGSLLSSILYICFLKFILYCFNLSLILKMPKFSLMTLLIFFCRKVYILLFQQFQFFFCLIGLATSFQGHTSEQRLPSL
jgi:hypothetical protein